MLKNSPGPIGVFDSGFGGLTILKEFEKKLPQYDYIYLGDNARSPYGGRSFYVVYQYTLQAVNHLFSQGCHLVILACNTASAKALRTIQQNDLPKIDSNRRVLGVIRPSAEAVGNLTKTREVGILGTAGTVLSESYPIEIEKLFPEIKTFQQACPLWVPLVENGEHKNSGADYFFEKDINALLSKSKNIDTIILGCTHYPLIAETIRKFVPPHIKLISQDTIIADSLIDYLNRHSEIKNKCTKNGTIKFETTDIADVFSARGEIFYGKEIKSEQITL
ncbi:MAG: glutamate racemase [Bacteroidia bacterium]|nr:glutamate racemase [Bacteroidia bacterium]